MRSLFVIVSFLATTACSDRAAFRPENVGAKGHGGQPAASYEIRSEPGADPHARVNVWSRGAEREDGRTTVDFTVSVRNTGDRPIALDRQELRVEAFDSSGAALPAPSLIAADAMTVAAGSARDIRLTYAFPAAIDPDAIATLRFRWGLDHREDGKYVQFTEFQRVREQYATTVHYYDPVFGSYDPFLYPHSHVHRVPVQRVIVVERDRPRSRPNP